MQDSGPLGISNRRQLATVILILAALGALFPAFAWWRSVTGLEPRFAATREMLLRGEIDLGNKPELMQILMQFGTEDGVAYLVGILDGRSDPIDQQVAASLLVLIDDALIPGTDKAARLRQRIQESSLNRKASRYAADPCCAAVGAIMESHLDRSDHAASRDSQAN